MNSNKNEEKYRDLFSQAAELEETIDLRFTNCSGFIKFAAENGITDKIGKNDIVLFKSTMKNKDAVCMLYPIPITRDKHISEKVMNIIIDTEEIFSYFDTIRSIKEDKVTYLYLIKHIE